MIVISTAHSSKMHGASNAKYSINEYDISKEASYACYDILRNNKIPCTLIDCGDLVDFEYSKYKTNLINSMIPKPELALEIHLNSFTDSRPNYCLVLYQDSNGSLISKKAAEFISDRISYACEHSIHPFKLPNKGAQKPDKRDFFLYDVHCPSIIVEGLFISNDEHASWLKSGGAQAYGVLVAEGILEWMKRI